MYEENGLIYCTQCGSANPSTFKFCSNCGARLEQPQEAPSMQSQESEPDQQESSETSVYEKPDAEVVSEGKVPLTQDELNINYGAEEEGTYSSGNSVAPNTQYYSASSSSSAVSSKTSTGGNSGFAIGSMVCGIISILCCCLTWVSLILAIAAIVLGIIALKYQYDGRGMAIAGIVTGGIGIFIWLIVLLVAGSGFFTSLVEEFSNM